VSVVNWLEEDMIMGNNYPRVGEVFELELDADAPANAPLPGIAQTFGCNPDGW